MISEFDVRFDAPARAARILVVDDNRGDALLMTRAFKGASIETELSFAETGEKALDLLREGDGLPDLILLDLNLPRMNGLAVLSALKDDAALAHVPVLILSSASADADVTESYRRQAAAYIVKPGSMEAIKRFAETVNAFFFGLARPAAGGRFRPRP